MEIKKSAQSKYHLEVSDVFTRDGPDCKVLLHHLQNEKPLSRPLIQRIVQQFVSIASSECNNQENQPNVLQLSDPLTIVGDIHGQYYDLLNILHLGGDPATSKYLFLGDYVDRGMFSFETLMALCAHKIRYPQTFFMLRGNHECRQLTSYFNFRQECLAKYDQEIYDLIVDLFDTLPIAAIINKRFFAVHGGLSPKIDTVDDVQKIHRFKEPARVGPFCDLLWSDPVSDVREATAFTPNSVRGCSYFFGQEACKTFLQRNNLLSVIRAHEVQLKGYKLHRWQGSSFPSVITVFSAPNYCDTYGNEGAIIKMAHGQTNFVQLTASPHPFVLTNFMDIFTWSCPFVAQKITEIFSHLLKQRYSKQEEMYVKEFECTQFMQSKLVEIITQFRSQRQRQHEQLMAPKPAACLTEKQFEQLRNSDSNEAYIEFGPKVQLCPLKLHYFEDDDLM